MSSSDPVFDVGEVAIFICDRSPEYSGCEVTIVEPIAHQQWIAIDTGEIHSGYAYGVRGPWPDGVWAVRSMYLQKKPPLREDLRIVRWDECPWQPAGVNA